MAKVSIIQRNKKRKKLVELYLSERQELKSVIYNKGLPADQRFQAQLRLDKLPKDSSRTRIRGMCRLTGRTRGYYRDFELSRICLRELASKGLLPGVKKASW